MSDEKRKPFAEATWYTAHDGSETAVLRAGGISVLTDDDATIEAMEPLAARINAAVEAREAKLRGALVLARGYVEAASQRLYDGTNGHRIRADAAANLAHIDEALAGDGPDYVPANEAAAFALRAAELELRCELLTDALAAFDFGRRADVVPFLRARGHEEKPIDALTVLELFSRLVQAGAHVKDEPHPTRPGARSYTLTMTVDAKEQREMQRKPKWDDLFFARSEALIAACPAEALVPAGGPRLDCHLPEGHAGDHRCIVNGRYRHWTQGPQGLSSWQEEPAPAPDVG